MKQRKKQWFTLYTIVVLTFIAFIISFPRVPIRFNIGELEYNQEFTGPDIDFTLLEKKFYKELNFDYGLYLGGGSRWTFDVDLESIPNEDRSSVFAEVRDQISDRMEVFDVENVEVGFVENEKYQITFDFVEKYIDIQELMMVSRMGKVEFMELKDEFRETEDQEILSDLNSYIVTELNNTELTGATVLINPTTSEPVIQLNLSDAGKQMLYEVSKRNIDLPIAITLDDTIIAAPRISPDLIEGDIGDPVISGGYTEDDARLLETVFDIGTLSVPLNFSNIEEVDPVIDSATLKNISLIFLIGAFASFVLVAIRYGWIGSAVKTATVLFPLFYIAVMKLGIPSVLVWALTSEMAETVFVNLPITVGNIAGFILSLALIFILNLTIIDNIKSGAGKKKINPEIIDSAYEHVLPRLKKLSGFIIVTSFVMGQFGPSMLGDLSIALVLGLIVGIFTTFVVLRNLLLLFAVRVKKK